MNVEACMTRDPKHCTTTDTLHRAAQIMWENDCGVVPVVDDRRKLVGVVTDRDLCMAGYTQGRALHEIPIERAMAKVLFTLSPRDGLDTVLRSMTTHLVRRLPVVDEAGVLVGIVSLADVVCAASEGRGGRHAKAEHVMSLVHALSKSRKPAAASPSAAPKDVIVPKARAQMASARVSLSTQAAKVAKGAKKRR